MILNRSFFPPRSPNPFNCFLTPFSRFNSLNHLVKPFSTASKKSKYLPSGIFAPIPTPFRPDGEIDFEKLNFNLSKWQNSSLDGLLVLGSNGEFALLNTEEKLKIVRFVTQKIKNKQILVGTSCESTKETVWMNQEVSKIGGVNGILVLPPHYYKRSMTDKALYQYFADVADASPLPTLLYNMPGNTGINLSSSLVVSLSKHPNIVGIKDSGGNIVQIAEMIRDTQNEHFAVFAGSVSFLLPSLVLGAKGATVALANCMPESCVAVYKLFHGGNLKEASQLQLSLLQPNALILEGTGSLKAALDLIGYQGGLPRSPILTPTSEELKKIEQIFEKLKSLEEKYNKFNRT